MTTISASASFQVPGGPTLALTSAIAAEAYDKIDIVLDAGATDIIVEIQPGPAARLRLLVIKSSLYGSEIKYVVSDGTAVAPAVTLDGPQMFIGPGVIGLFTVAPKNIKFSNANTAVDKKAQIEILVGRDATP